MFLRGFKTSRFRRNQLYQYFMYRVSGFWTLRSRTATRTMVMAGALVLVVLVAVV